MIFLKLICLRKLGESDLSIEELNGWIMEAADLIIKTLQRKKKIAHLTQKIRLVSFG